MAATRVNACGVNGLAALLEDGLGLLTSGRRTAQPRHQTMCAALDWSYNLLTGAEQAVLRRLAVFAGKFTLHAAGTVAADESHTESKTMELTAELVAKSLIVAEGDHEPRLRLLETTRAYALGKLSESGELEALTRRYDLMKGVMPMANQHMPQMTGLDIAARLLTQAAPAARGRDGLASRRRRPAGPDWCAARRGR